MLFKTTKFQTHKDIDDSELHIDLCNMFRNERLSHGGGVSLFVQENLTRQFPDSRVGIQYKVLGMNLEQTLESAIWLCTLGLVMPLSKLSQRYVSETPSSYQWQQSNLQGLSSLNIDYK